MITNYFNFEKNKIDYEYFEIYRSFISKNTLNNIYNEVKNNLVINGTRSSCICVSSNFNYDLNPISSSLPKITFTKNIETIKDKIVKCNNCSIDYVLVHYYKDEKSVINWHSDREALRSPIYSVNIGGTRRFCLRNKKTKKLYSFDLHDGDLFIMKVGCQDIFEHCIKSIKIFNKPRINVTLRQLEEPITYFIYDIDNLTVINNINIFENAQNNGNLKIIKKLRQGIIVGYVISKVYSEKYIANGQKITNNLSLLKSNLQKAIRRKEKNVALNTSIKLIMNGFIVELLRRLTIITFEDVSINIYFPIIVWYYVVLSENISSYTLTLRDIEIIYSYVAFLCDMDEKINIDKKNELIPLNEICNNIYCLSLYVRIQYGGFNGEIKLMDSLICMLQNSEIIIDNKTMDIIDIYYPETIEILDSAIDFHCFPSMAKKISEKNEKYNLSETDIKHYIWVFSSNVNNRFNEKYDENEIKIWKEIIEPQCINYRKFIKSVINII